MPGRMGGGGGAARRPAFALRGPGSGSEGAGPREPVLGWSEGVCGEPGGSACPGQGWEVRAVAWAVVFQK